MPQGDQNQSFDPVAELRSRYPGTANEPDEKVHEYLSDPKNFRAAFPEYKDLDDDTIKRNMTATEQPLRPGPNGTMVRRPAPMNAEQAAVKVRKLEAEDPASVSGQLGVLSQGLGEKAEAARLSELGKPGVNPYLSKGAAYDALARLTQIGAGATEPKSVAIGAATAAVPEVMGPVLVGHGLYTAGEHAPGALRGNPEDVEAGLLGLSEAAGGGAAAGHGIASDVARLKAVHELTPIRADTLPQAAEFHPALANTPKEVLTHAAQEGIELTPGQATQAPVARMLQALGERSLFGADKLTEGMDRNAAAFMKSVRGFADRVDPKGMGLSEEGAGEAIRQAAQTAKDVSHTNAAAGYKALEAHAQQPVTTQPITNAWMSLRESMPVGVEDRILAEVPRNMRATVDEMLSPSGMKTPLTFEQAINLRSFFREMGDAEGLSNRLQGAFRRMSEATDKAMETTAKKNGFENDWRQANAGWKDYVARYGDKQSPLYQILHQADPAKITRTVLNKGSAADIEMLQQEGMSAALDAIKRQVVEDIARNKFGVGRNGLGGYSHSFLRTLFGDAATKELYLKSDLGRRFNWQINPSGTGNVMVAEHQVTHPEPSKLGLLYGAAQASMPREATSFIAGNTPVPTRLFPIGAAPPMLREGAEETRRLLPARRAQ